MRKLALIALAGTALALPAAAFAQAGPRASSGHSFGNSRSHVNVRHQGTSSATARSHANAVSRSHATAVSGGQTSRVVHRGGSNVVVRQGGSHVSVNHGGRHFRHPGPNFRHHRIQRGGMIHPYWFGPQFHVQDWRLYGFAEPPRDHRWVRYYDDAYLIDREGRVQDTRYGLDWDEYGERWDSDAGIPSYYGRGDYRPDERDYAWVESQERGAYAEGPGYDGHGERYADEAYGGEAYADGAYADGAYADDAYAEEGYYAERRGGAGYGYGPAYPPAPACQPCGGYGYGAGHGYYGWGVAYPIIIETTVVTGGTSYVEEVTEEVVEVRQAQRQLRAHRPPPRQRPRPRPPAGERG